MALGAVFLSVVLLGGLTGQAQITITSITTTTNTTAGTTTETGSNPTTLNFQNDIRAINTFNAGGNDYYIAGSATTVAVRRNAVAGTTKSSMWSASVNTTTVVGTDKDDYGALLRDNNIFQGADNVFVNGTAVSQGNIERLDFIWNAGVTVQASDGFAVFDRGAAGAHDAFQVAAITGLGSGAGSPLTWTFGSVMELGAGNYGSNLDLDNNGSVDNIAYRLLRYNNNDVLTTHTAATETGSQGLAGVFITFADLGISAGTTIYGYAIMGLDVTNTSANLADWSSATYYPTNTADASGGIDLTAFNGQFISRVPEPSTYGALLLLLGGTALGFRRWRQNLRPA